MTKKQPAQTQGVSPLLFGGISIGQWEDDVEADRIRGDAVMARLFGLPEHEMAEGISLARLISLFHPEDRNTDTDHRRRIRTDGGSFAWEHRVVPAPGEVRWLLARGQFHRDTDGRVRGRGVVIDITDTRVHNHGPGPAAFLAADGGGPPLERMAARVLDAWDMRSDVGVNDWTTLRPLFETLLLELGHRIAATLSEGPSPETRPPGASRMH